MVYLSAIGQKFLLIEVPMNEQNTTSRARKIISLISIGVFIFFILFLAWLIGDPMMEFVSDPDGFRDWVDSHGIWGPVIYIIMMTLQIIVAIIPAGPIEMAAGYAFGTFWGTVLCMIGSAFGSAIVFTFVRKLGYKAVEAFFPREKIDSLKFLQKNKRLEFLVFIFFLIPGAPKDVLTYFVGLTRLKCSTFLLLTTIARIPTFVMTVLSGDALGEQQYVLAIVIMVVTMALCGVGLLIYQAIVRKQQKL